MVVAGLLNQGPVWVGINVHWQVEGQTPRPWVQAGAYLGVHWPAEEGHGVGGHLEEEALVGVSTGLVLDGHKVRVEGDGRWVQEGEKGHVVPGLEEAFGPLNRASL